jgi:hypothetical protein
MGQGVDGELDTRQTGQRPEKLSERARLAEALRENLRRRKAQNRARAATSEARTASEPKPSA